MPNKEKGSGSARSGRRRGTNGGHTIRHSVLTDTGDGGMKDKGKRQHLTSYHYKECGLENVYLIGGVSVRETPRGKSITIEDVEELHKVIAESLLSEKKRLNGRELRFLRHELNLTQEALAALLGTDHQSVARWEKGQYKVPGPADRLIRFLYRESAKGNAGIIGPLRRLAELDELLNDEENPPMRFSSDLDGWHRAA